MSESPERTGHPDVDAAIDAVVSLEDRPVAEHLAAYEAAHALLHQALSDTPAPAEAESPSDLAADPAADPADVRVGEPAVVPAGTDQPAG